MNIAFFFFFIEIGNLSSFNVWRVVRKKKANIGNKIKEIKGFCHVAKRLVITKNSESEVKRNIKK